MQTGVEEKNFLNDLSLGCLIIIGIAQSLALVPGVSRSGITITAALMLGFSRKTAVSISAILAVPVIGLSAGLELSHFLQIADCRMVFDVILVLGMSCLSAYISLLFLFKLVEKVGMTPFCNLPNDFGWDSSSIIRRLILVLLYIHYGFSYFFARSILNVWLIVE